MWWSKERKIKKWSHLATNKLRDLFEMALDMSNTANNGVDWEKVFLCGWWPHDMDGSSNDRFEDVQTTYLKEKKKKQKELCHSRHTRMWKQNEWSWTSY